MLVSGSPDDCPKVAPQRVELFISGWNDPDGAAARLGCVGRTLGVDETGVEGL